MQGTLVESERGRVQEYRWDGIAGKTARIHKRLAQQGGGATASVRRVR
jgi:hypothetical protein